MPPAVAMAIAGLASAGVAAGSSYANNKANAKARAIETKYGDEALSDARAERARQQQIDDEERRFSRDQLAQQLAYRSGRDSIEDARFNDERDFTRGEFGSYKQRLAPFSNAGSQAVANLSSVVGRNLPASIPTTGAGGMVRLQAPNGVIREVPASHAAHYTQLGAKVV